MQFKMSWGNILVNKEAGMKIPKSIKVGGHTYKIVWDEHLWHEENIHGQADYVNHTITLDPYGHSEMIAVVFIHEVLHVIDKHFDNKALTEEEIDSLGEGLFQVFSDMGITFTK